MRISSVSRERISIQQEFGSSCVPMELRQLITCFTRLAPPLILPPTRSLWPPTYLVREHSEMSAPHFSGVWNIGPSIVLSTATGGLYPWDVASSSAIVAQAARSTRPLVGLAGVLAGVNDTRACAPA